MLSLPPPNHPFITRNRKAAATVGRSRRSLSSSAFVLMMIASFALMMVNNDSLVCSAFVVPPATSMVATKKIPVTVSPANTLLMSAIKEQNNEDDDHDEHHHHGKLRRFVDRVVHPRRHHHEAEEKEKNDVVLQEPSKMEVVETNESNKKKNVVVIGNGMVGQRFMENLIKLDKDKQLQLTTFCEEPYAAYNRVKLTSYFKDRDPSSLCMTGKYSDQEDEGDDGAVGSTPWYKENNVNLLLNDRATEIDTKSKTITSDKTTIKYDACVFATGSKPYVPPIPGRDRPGVFVYRTIKDLEQIAAYCKNRRNKVKSAAIIGGGLLGLEAAKATQDLGIKETHIVEFAPILMCNQIDEDGSKVLVDKIQDMYPGIQVHCNARTAAFVGKDGSTSEEEASSKKPSPVAALKFSNEDWDDLPVQLVIISCGIKPRDELARAEPNHLLEFGERGGVVVDDYLRTSAVNVYAVGEIALHHNKIYGLVGPGYTMANVCADVVANDMGIFTTPQQEEELLPKFEGQDMPTLLKLMGVDVCTFGINRPNPHDDVMQLQWNDPMQRVYRKLTFNKSGTKLLGAVLVGDAEDFYDLIAMKDLDELDVEPFKLLPPVSARGTSKEVGTEIPADDPKKRICHCNQISRGEIADAVMKLGANKATLANVKKLSNAGTGCGGCDPQIKEVIDLELEKMGSFKPHYMCEHFNYSRPELMAKLRLEDDLSKVDSFEKILAKYGNGGDGCEVCKPTVGSILQVLTNRPVLDDGRDALQDTNDRSLANMQRGGSYSIIPRTPAGELAPDQLIKIGETAKKFHLYTKITGAQRVGLFGAAKHELPDIWEELGSVGLESGTAFGKGLRAVKSCVGSNWCRFGLQDSVGLAIKLENRYKGIRTPHKMKGGVAACIRDCAEARGKDFGLIATKDGYNLYLGGNSGANPRHADLFASDIDETTVQKYLDRYIMYYILTADKLERMATWQQKLPSPKTGGGPIEHLREVIIDDSLGICDELDQRMNTLVETYHDDWSDIVQDPNRRKKFQQFVNTDETISKDDMIEFVTVRGQTRPVDWPKDGKPQTNWHAPRSDVFAKSEKSWVKVGSVKDFPPNEGSQILVGDTQLAVFHIESRNEWYCTQNMCPHKQAFVLSQGIMGDSHGIVKVACPLHKKKFALATGKGLDDEDLEIITFPIKVTDDDDVMVKLPAIPELDAILGTHGLRVHQTCETDVAGDAEELPVVDKMKDDDERGWHLFNKKEKKKDAIKAT